MERLKSFVLVRINFGIAAIMAGILLFAAFQSQSNRPTTGGNFPIATGELVSTQLAPFYGLWAICSGMPSTRSSTGSANNL